MQIVAVSHACAKLVHAVLLINPIIALAVIRATAAAPVTANNKSRSLRSGFYFKIIL